MLDPAQLPGKWCSFPPKITALEDFSNRFRASRIRGDAADVMFMTFPTGATTPTKTIDIEVWGVVLQGSMRLTIDGHSRRFSAGDWYHVPPGTTSGAEFRVHTELIEFWFNS